jgi:hypothetical protein
MSKAHALSRHVSKAHALSTRLRHVPRVEAHALSTTWRHVTRHATGHEATITGLAFSSVDPTRLFSGSRDWTVRLVFASGVGVLYVAGMLQACCRQVAGMLQVLYSGGVTLTGAREPKP